MSNNRTLGNLGQLLDSAASGSAVSKRNGSISTIAMTDSDVGGVATSGFTDSNLIKNIIDINHITKVGGITSSSDGLKAILQGNAPTALNPSASATYDLGDSSNPIDEIILDSSATIYFGELSMTSLLMSGSSANVSSGAGGAAAVWYGDRGLYAGGTGAGTSNQIEYISVNISSNASDFGDLTVSRGQMGAASNGTRAVWAGGYDYGNSIRENTMDYVTVATTSNAQDFGDLTESVSALFHSVVGDGTYGFRCGGNVSSSRVTTIDSWTLDTTGNASDHGDLSIARSFVGAACDGTYGVIAGGNDAVSFYLNTIDTFTTATASNASDFGDLQNAKYNIGVGYDTTRAVFAAGWTGSGAINVIDYVTMATPSNASDFGDLIAGEYPAGTSDGTYVCFATGTGLGANIHQITIQTLGNAVDTGYDLITSYSNGSGGVSGSSS